MRMHRAQNCASRKGECYLSNRKLTTEEKIEKSKQITEEISKIEKRLKESRDAQKKLDAEIADELEKEYIVNMQKLGKCLTEKIGTGLSLEQYLDMLDYIFMIDEVSEYVASEKQLNKQKTEAADSPNAASA